MRLIVFFDLPVLTPVQRRRYARFRKFLVKDGFLMMQESVYSKLVINDAAASGAILRLQCAKPSEGLVQVLKVTEKQFATMVTVTGEQVEREEVNTTEEFLVL